MDPTVNYRNLLREIIAKEARPSHKFGHQPRLYELCRQIGSGISYDDDVVFAAVWLHDLGVFDGNRPSDPVELQRWNHVSYAVRRAAEILEQTDFPADKVSRAIAAIEEHQPHDTPASIEATILRDADILEQLGSIAVLRTAAKLGSDTRFILFSNVRDYLRRQLVQLPKMLQLPRSKELAESRLAVLKHFLEELELEAGDHLD